MKVSKLFLNYNLYLKTAIGFAALIMFANCGKANASEEINTVQAQKENNPLYLSLSFSQYEIQMSRFSVIGPILGIARITAFAEIANHKDSQNLKNKYYGFGIGQRIDLPVTANVQVQAESNLGLTLSQGMFADAGGGIFIGKKIRGGFGAQMKQHLYFKKRSDLFVMPKVFFEAEL